LRELATKKNLEFRRRMIGKTLSVVTLKSRRTALSDNFLKVEIATLRPANQLIEVEIGELSDCGLRETSNHRALPFTLAGIRRITLAQAPNRQSRKKFLRGTEPQG